MVAPTDLNVVLKFVCRGGYYPPVYDNPSVIFLRKCHLPLHKGGVFLVLSLLLGVAFIDCRGRRPRRPVYKNIIAFCTGRRGAAPYRFGGGFDVVIVGATIGRPSFIKISFCLKRTVGDAGPYRFGGRFDVLVVGAIHESPAGDQWSPLRI